MRNPCPLTFGVKRPGRPGPESEGSPRAGLDTMSDLQLIDRVTKGRGGPLSTPDYSKQENRLGRLMHRRP
jgi:hypothetical protein